MKIEKLEIQNFRKIKHAEYTFGEHISIISGYNELGKTTTLNALTWILSSTLVGDGDDIIDSKNMDSIMPNDYVRGVIPTVSIWVGNTKFTKKYVTNYKRGSDAISGRTNDYYINDIVCKNADEFTEELYRRLDYIPAFKKLNVREVNLFTDPLYAFMKLDYKELRKLFVAMGCSVTNEELYQMKPEYRELQKYEADYLGKFDTMKSDYKKKKLTLENFIKDKNNNLSLFEHVKDYSTDNLDRLNSEKENLITEKANINNANYNSKLAELKLQLSSVKQEQENYLKVEYQTINNNLANLNNEKEYELSKIKQLNSSEIATTKYKIDALNQKINDTNSMLKGYERAKQEALSKMDVQKNIGIRSNKNINEYQVKLGCEIDTEFTGNTTCPYCGKDHHISEAAFTKFEADKQEKIKFYNDAIAKFNLDKENAKNEYLGLKNRISDADYQIKICNENKQKYEAEMQELEGKLSVLESTLETEINKYLAVVDGKISALKVEQSKVPTLEENKKYQAKINDILNQISAIENNEELETKTKIDAINLTISELEIEIGAEYAMKKDFETRKKISKEIEEATHQLNDVNFIYQTVCDFINDMIRLVNEKAKELTGIDFVMLENTLSETVKDVCYAVYDGVKFENINSAKKIELGIQFIEKCKDIACKMTGKRNTLPILIDDMEKVSETEKIKEFTQEQLICTRVSTGKNIEIIGE